MNNPGRSSFQSPPSPVRARGKLHRMSLAGVPADAQPLRSGLHADQPRGRMLADPAVLVSEHAFQFVPAFQQTFRVARQAKIDHVLAIAGI